MCDPGYTGEALEHLYPAPAKFEWPFFQDVSMEQSLTKVESYVMIRAGHRTLLLDAEDLLLKCKTAALRNHIIPNLCRCVIYGNHKCPDVLERTSLHSYKFLHCDWVDDYEHRAELEVFLGFLVNNDLLNELREIEEMTEPYVVHSCLTVDGFDDSENDFLEYAEEAYTIIFNPWEVIWEKKREKNRKRRRSLTNAFDECMGEANKKRVLAPAPVKEEKEAVEEIGEYEDEEEDVEVSLAQEVPDTPVRTPEE